jgi:hypothetical protein
MAAHVIAIGVDDWPITALRTLTDPMLPAQFLNVKVWRHELFKLGLGFLRSVFGF